MYRSASFFDEAERITGKLATMKYPMKQDFLLAVRKASFYTPGSIVCSVINDGKPVIGLTNASVCRKFIDSTMLRTVVCGTIANTGIRLTAETIEFRDFPFITHTVTVENPMDEDFACDWLTYFDHEICGDNVKLIGADGTEQPLGIYGGKKAYLCYSDSTVMIEADGDLHFRPDLCGAGFGMGVPDFKLAAGQSYTFPTIKILVCAGDKARCEDLYRAWAQAHE